MNQRNRKPRPPRHENPQPTNQRYDAAVKFEPRSLSVECLSQAEDGGGGGRIVWMPQLGLQSGDKIGKELCQLTPLLQFRTYLSN
jgi:hypothetical protein